MAKARTKAKASAKSKPKTKSAPGKKSAGKSATKSAASKSSAKSRRMFVRWNAWPRRIARSRMRAGSAPADVPQTATHATPTVDETW